MIKEPENESRRDFVIDREVIITVNRAKRPTDFAQKPRPPEARSGPCFFCPGNEHLTPPETERIPKEKGEWKVRCFPNKFFAVSTTSKKAYGYHEVLVETPEHDKTLSDLSVEHIRLVLKMYANRTRAFARDKKIEYVCIFKNEGGEAGASLRHTHSQLVAMDNIPPKTVMIYKQNEAYMRKYRKCGFCDRKRLEKPRIVYEDKHVLAYCPYCSRFHFETWIQTKRHVGLITELNEEEITSFAIALKKILGKLDRELNRPPYNYFLQMGPLKGKRKGAHFRIEICPRLSKWAGFEYSTNVILNSLLPEKAAEEFRKP